VGVAGPPASEERGADSGPVCSARRWALLGEFWSRNNGEREGCLALNGSEPRTPMVSAVFSGWRVPDFGEVLAVFCQDWAEFFVVIRRTKRFGESSSWPYSSSGVCGPVLEFRAVKGFLVNWSDGLRL